MRRVRFRRLFNRPILFFSFILLLNPRPAQAELKNFDKFEYPKRLYLKKDYYRAASEILRLQFNYPRQSVKHQLDLYLLKSHYHLKNYRGAEAVVRQILKSSHYRSNRALRQETALWLSGALLKQDKEEKAALMWRELVGDSGGGFPLSQNTQGLIDPEKVEFYSLFPGLGLATCGEHGKAAVSFLLNALFVGAAYHYFQNREYGSSALALFFEAGWYKGGRKAAREAAVNHNRRLIDRRRKNWLRSQAYRFFPKRTDEFEAIYRDISGVP